MINKLRDGNIVEFRNGERAIILDEDFLVNQWDRAFFLPTDYDKDSGKNNFKEKFDIVKIYDKHILKIIGAANALSPNYKLPDPVWEAIPNLFSVLSQFDIIEYRNGKRAILIDNKFISYTGYMSKEDYQENGKIKSTDSDFDIIRIFRFPSLDSFRVGFAAVLGKFAWYQLNAKLIWENI